MGLLDRVFGGHKPEPAQDQQTQQVNAEWQQITAEASKRNSVTPGKTGPNPFASQSQMNVGREAAEQGIAIDRQQQTADRILAGSPSQNWSLEPMQNVAGIKESRTESRTNMMLADQAAEQKPVNAATARLDQSISAASTSNRIDPALIARAAEGSRSLEKAQELSRDRGLEQNKSATLGG